MFGGWESFLNLSNFNTQNVKNIGKYVWLLLQLNIFKSNFNIQNIINIRYMFRSCHYLKTLVLSNFNIKKVKDMSEFFDGVYIPRLDLSSFVKQNIEDN